MLDQLIQTLLRTENEAADDLLTQALRLGLEHEQRVALDVLLRRKTVRGLSGIIAVFDDLPKSLQETALRNIRLFNHALAECGRSDDTGHRLAAMRMIAVGRQGKLAYVLSENLHNPDPVLSNAATEALLTLAKWIATETLKLQNEGSGEERDAGTDGGEEDAGTRGRGDTEKEGDEEDAGTRGHGDTEKDGDEKATSHPASPRLRVPVSLSSPFPASPRPRVTLSLSSAPYGRLISERPEIEAAVARAMSMHRGTHGHDLLRAALLLADWPGSKTLGLLHTAKHSGQTAMVRRLQQPPDAEHVSAFLLGASQGQLRSHFGSIFSHIDQAAVLDAIVLKTHWLKDHQLQICLHQVTRGAWWGLSELNRELDRRGPEDAPAIAEWVANSGLHDVEQDERLQILLERIRRDMEDGSPASLSARLRLLRIAMRRRRGASVSLIKLFLTDSDERIMRMSAREIMRRKPADYENLLLKMMTSATPSVRRVIGRAIGGAGFDNFWQRFDKLDKSTRKQAGKAMLKLLPDAIQRLQRRALAGTPEQRVKSMQIVQELGIAGPMQETLIQLCTDSHPRVRSKAVTVLGETPNAPSDLLVERLMNDTDARVRANAVEVLEARGDPQFVPLLAQRAMAATGRERANAIKALHRMKVGPAGGQLLNMLKDDRAEHRISALWALRQIGWWQLLNEVGNLAKTDDNVRVRRYAVGVLKTVAELVREQKKAAG
jgi:HEAT repeat protein